MSGVYLSCGVGPDFRTAVDVHCFIHMFINLKRDISLYSYEELPTSTKQVKEINQTTQE